MVAGNVKIDAKRRVVLPPGLVKDNVTFHIYANNFGQIVLDPQISIPASEAWLYKNPEALEAVRQGLQDLAEGRVSKIDLKKL